mgnify:CR=1 FL=1|tara:strand:+ start:227 stop:3001 length:2775 start_codon:yes stop_codon:yes gene_type:complete
MPFSTKQSDVFYNDQTKEMFVCTVSAITAARCTDGETLYGSLPIIYKIDKDTNYKQTVYPENLDTFLTDENSDLYRLVPPCPVEDLDFDSITKPLINFNTDTSRYSVTFLGRFSSDVHGLIINNYIFENVDNRFHLLKAKSLLPQNSLSAANGRFTFDGGYLNSDLYVGGNTVRNQTTSWFNPDDGTEIERSPNYMIGPTYVESNSALSFNSILDDNICENTALTGNRIFPFMFGGSYISVNPKYLAFDPEHTIRVDFRARSFNTTAPSAYGSTQTVGTEASRWLQMYDPTGAGEGFCVYFYKQPISGSYVVPNGVGSTLGYSPAEVNLVEVAGSAHTTVGLYERTNWTPTGTKSGNIGEGSPANSFLGVAFDINGQFATTLEDKPGWYDGNSTYTATPCSVSIRGNRFTNNKVLTAVALSSVPGSTSIPLHTSAADADFVDYRIDLSNKGNRLTIYHKLTSSTDYNTILDVRLNKIQGTGAGNEYEPWSGFDVDLLDENYPLINVGLSFTTSTKVSQFELLSFEVDGIKVHNPWNIKDKITDERRSRIDYVNKSSIDLRKRLLNVNTDENVDLEMNIKAVNNIANDIYEENNTTEITLCDDNKPDIPERDVDLKYTSINPELVDKAVRIAEKGILDPIIPGLTIPTGTRELTNNFKEIDVEDPGGVVLPSPADFNLVCATKNENQVYVAENIKYGTREYTIFIRARKVDTFDFYVNEFKEIVRQNIRSIGLEELFVDAIDTDYKTLGANYTKCWELMTTVVSNEAQWTDADTDYDNPEWNWVARGTREEANEFFETRVCALEKPNVPWGLTNTGKSCTKVTIIELKTILLKELENVTLKYVGNVPFGLQQVAHGYGTFKDYYLQLNTSNDQGCYWISANENTTLDFDPQKPYKYDLEDTINNVKQQLRDMGNKGVLKGRITGL